MSTKPDTDEVGPMQPQHENAEKVAVYSFEFWDPAQRKNVVAPYLAAPNTIRRLKGMADLSSKLVIDRAALDSCGFYSSNIPP
jgi:hypothetical protein